jgi:membrane-associated phospholipid phosphatase
MNFLEGEFGIRLIELLQNGTIGKFAWYILLPFHYLGSEFGYLLLLPVIYWSANKKLGKELFILVLFSTIFTNLLKTWWGRPRPFHVAPDRIVPIEKTPEFGLPSGHTIFGTVLGLSLLNVLKKKRQILLAVVFIVLMGVSRMIHGMHFMQDVVLGWILGLLFFYIFHKLNPTVIRFFNNQNLFRQIMVTTVPVFVLFVIFILVEGDFEYKKSLLSPLGGVFGGILGIFIENRYIKFSDTKRNKIRILRTIVGLVTMIMFYALADFLYYAIVGAYQNNIVLFLYVIRYAIVGCWITAGAPCIFKRFKLN